MTFRNLTILLSASTIAVVALIWCALPTSFRHHVTRDSIAPHGRALAAVSSTLAGASPDAASTQALLLKTYQDENADLRRALGFVQHNPSLIAAEVLSSHAGDAWSQRIRIGKGASNNIRLHAPVLTPEGLLGHIIDVTDSTADVLLLSDPNSHVSCEVADATGTLVHGVLSGTGHATPWNLAPDGVSPPLRLDYLNRHSTPAPNAIAYTSGLGGLYPRGLPVGRIDSVTTDSSGYYSRANVSPAVSLQALRFVFVLSEWEVKP